MIGAVLWVMFVLTPTGHGDRIVTMQSFMSEKACWNAVSVLKKTYSSSTAYCVAGY